MLLYSNANAGTFILIQKTGEDDKEGQPGIIQHRGKNSIIVLCYSSFNVLKIFYEQGENSFSNLSVCSKEVARNFLQKRLQGLIDDMSVLLSDMKEIQEELIKIV